MAINLVVVWGLVVVLLVVLLTLWPECEPFRSDPAAFCLHAFADEAKTGRPASYTRLRSENPAVTADVFGAARAQWVAHGRS
jgi:hypothetical protein